METAELQASLQSPLFSRLVEDGDLRSDLIWASRVTLHFFPLCVLKRCSPHPLYFEPKPNLSKTLKGLLMRLVIFENTIFQLNSLNITVFVCYVSGSKVTRKRAVRLCLFVFFYPPCKIYHHLGAFGSIVSVSCLGSKTGIGSLCGSA